MQKNTDCSSVVRFDYAFINKERLLKRICKLMTKINVYRQSRAAAPCALCDYCVSVRRMGVNEWDDRQSEQLHCLPIRRKRGFYGARLGCKNMQTQETMNKPKRAISKDADGIVLQLTCVQCHQADKTRQKLFLSWH